MQNDCAIKQSKIYLNKKSKVKRRVIITSYSIAI